MMQENLAQIGLPALERGDLISLKKSREYGGMRILEKRIHVEHSIGILPLRYLPSGSIVY